MTRFAKTLLVDPNTGSVANHSAQVLAEELRTITSPDALLTLADEYAQDATRLDTIPNLASWATVYREHSDMLRQAAHA